MNNTSIAQAQDRIRGTEKAIADLLNALQRAIDLPLDSIELIRYHKMGEVHAQQLVRLTVKI